MTVTRIFKSGNSQAVRIPREFQFKGKEVEIFKRGNEVILREKRTNLAEAFQLLTEMPDDFMQEGRQDIPPQDREAWV